MINKPEYLGKYKTLDELLSAVGQLPSDINYISVQSALVHFQPPSIKLNYSEDLVSKVQEIITEALKEQDRWGTITGFYLNSYFGGRTTNDSLYISLSSEQSIKFGNDMSSGKYGPLD
jgi:hypothetical protein